MAEPSMYKRYAAEYAAHAEHGACNALYDRHAELDLVGDVTGQTVLDAACGPGLYAAELTARGARVIGFDGSRTCAGVAAAADRRL